LGTGAQGFVQVGLGAAEREREHDCAGKECEIAKERLTHSIGPGYESAILDEKSG
jgi:hypothetical protein